MPDLLHTTVWRLDGKVISARIGFRDRNRGQVSLGYLAHSPFLADHSPGRLHVYLLGLLLVEEGIAELNLTAGGDPYKERFATHFDEVRSPDRFFLGCGTLGAAARAAARRTARRALGMVSVTPDDVRRATGRVRSLSHRLLGTLRAISPRGRSATSSFIISTAPPSSKMTSTVLFFGGTHWATC